MPAFHGCSDGNLGLALTRGDIVLFTAKDILSLALLLEGGGGLLHGDVVQPRCEQFL